MSETRFEQLEGGKVRVNGDLTFSTVSGALRESAAVFGTGHSPLDIDLSGVGRADSAGLALLIHWLRQARTSGREILFRNLPDQMLAIARVSDLEAILPRDEA